jgi:hypothetical protein
MKDETAYVLLPEGEWILAQDKRSAVLGKRQYTSQSPVGTVRNRCPEQVLKNQQLAIRTESCFFLGVVRESQKIKV